MAWKRKTFELIANTTDRTRWWSITHEIRSILLYLNHRTRIAAIVVIEEAVAVMVVKVKVTEAVYVALVNSSIKWHGSLLHKTNVVSPIDKNSGVHCPFFIPWRKIYLAFYFEFGSITEIVKVISRSEGTPVKQK